MMETSWYDWISKNMWSVEALVILLLLFLFNFLLKKMLNRTKRQGQVNERDWRLNLDRAALAPARVLLWVLIIAFGLDIGLREFELEGRFLWLQTLRNVLIVLCLSWFLIRWKKVFHNAIAARRVKGKLTFDPVSLEIVGKVFTIGVIFVSFLIILQLFGLDIIPLITFGGIGAAALGIASKDVIANFFGGLMLYVTRPFTVNDLIELPEKKISGHIEEIGWYLTSIRDLNKKPIYIPNSIFSTEVLINQSRMTHRRIEETIQIRLSDTEKVLSIVESIRTLFEHHPEIDHNQSVYVFFKTFGPYFLEIEVLAYTLATRYEEFMEIKQKILIEIDSIVAKAGAEMPYPTSAVEIRELQK